MVLQFRFFRYVLLITEDVVVKRLGGAATQRNETD